MNTEEKSTSKHEPAVTGSTEPSVAGDEPPPAAGSTLARLRHMRSAQSIDSEASSRKKPSVVESLMLGQRRQTRCSIASLGLSMRFARNLHAARASIKEKPEKTVYMENTFRMQPDSDCRFSTARVRIVIQEVLTPFLRAKTYSADAAARWTCDLSNRVLNRVKKCGFRRYKLIAHVVLGSPTDTDVDVVSRCVWAHAVDDFASYTFRNEKIFGVATVYGVYFE